MTIVEVGNKPLVVVMGASTGGVSYGDTMYGIFADSYNGCCWDGGC